MVASVPLETMRTFSQDGHPLDDGLGQPHLALGRRAVRGAVAGRRPDGLDDLGMGVARR